MRRREALIAPIALLAALSGWTQQAGKVYRIGFLRPGRPTNSFITSLETGLRELGYVNGRNIVIEYRFEEERFDRLTRLV